jgi:hypothetical protein
VKNIQVIDGADNCTFPVFAVTDEEFGALFPDEGQDLEFADDVVSRIGDSAFAALMAPVWSRPVRKSEAAGLHGTLFYGFAPKRVSFPVTKREADWNRNSLNAAQRPLTDK